MYAYDPMNRMRARIGSKDDDTEPRLIGARIWGLGRLGQLKLLGGKRIIDES